MLKRQDGGSEGVSASRRGDVVCGVVSDSGANGASHIGVLGPFQERFPRSAMIASWGYRSGNGPRTLALKTVHRAMPLSSQTALEERCHVAITSKPLTSAIKHTPSVSIELKAHVPVCFRL